MTTIMVVLAAGLCVVACVDGGPQTGAPPDPPSPPTSTEQASISAHRAPDPGPDICDLLPADGPCSLACDPAALAAQYVPVGACASFACTLTDGRMIVANACHYPD